MVDKNVNFVLFVDHLEKNSIASCAADPHVADRIPVTGKTY